MPTTTASDVSSLKNTNTHKHTHKHIRIHTHTHTYTHTHTRIYIYIYIYIYITTWEGILFYKWTWMHRLLCSPKDGIFVKHFVKRKRIKRRSHCYWFKWEMFLTFLSTFNIIISHFAKIWNYYIKSTDET